MNVKIQGNTVLSDYDIFAEVGKDTVQVKTIPGVSADDRLTVEIESVHGRTSISGIELIAE